MSKNQQPSCDIQGYVTSFSEEVTGSNTVIQVKWPSGRDVTMLVDCGLFQEAAWKDYNNCLLPYTASKIDFAIATHVHTDHIGRFPYLCKSNFKGPIYASFETGEIFTTMLDETLTQMNNDLKDEVSIWKEKVKKIKAKNKAGKKDRSKCTEKFIKKCKEALPVKPTLLYTIEDIKKCYSQLKITDMNTVFKPCDGFEVTFFQNAHILGAICAFCRAFDDDNELCFFVTGDLGMTNPLSKVETKIPKRIRDKVDFIISESTYGAEQISRNIEDERIKHAEILNEYLNKKGTIVYMSNSLERPEVLALDLKRMQKDPLTANAMKNVPIYFDTTLGIKCLKKYKKILRKDFLPKNWKIVTKVDREEVMKGHRARIIICTSPLLYRGSFKCYGKAILQNSNAAMLFVAYVGDAVTNIISKPEGFEFIYESDTVVKKCLMERFYTYSSHASKKDLKKFLLSFENCKFFLLQHGSSEAKDTLAAELSKKQRAEVLQYGKTVVVTSKGVKKVYDK